MWMIKRLFDGKHWKTGKYLSAAAYESNWCRFLRKDCQQFPGRVIVVGYRLDQNHQWVEDRRHPAD
jgi:hypothetical protein